MKDNFACCVSALCAKCRSKLYIPSTIKTEKDLLKTHIWAEKKWAYRIVHQVKTKILNNVAIYNLILNLQLNLVGQCLEYLGYITLV